MSAIPAAFPRPLSKNNAIDAITHGYYWILDSSRTLNWAIANGPSGESWTNPAEVYRSVSLALDVFAYYANIKFNFNGFYSSPLNVGNTQLTFSLEGNGLIFNSSSTWAVGFFPAQSYSALYASAPGDIYLNIRSQANFLPSYAAGSTGFALILHEIGHALGLKHPHDDGGTGRPTFSGLGIDELDIDWFSVMSYNDDFAWNQIGWEPFTLMALDALGLMYLYGPNMATNVGDTTFNLLNANGYYTVWDAGGEDIINLSASTTGWEVALQFATNEVLGIDVGVGVTTSQLNPSQPTNLVWLLGTYENLIGSSYADFLVGSESANEIFGGGGNDTIDGAGGNDLLVGGDGSDQVDGGAGFDLVLFSGFRSSFGVTMQGKSIQVKALAGAGGVDVLSNVERLYFNDSALSFDAVGAQAYRIYQAAFNRTPDLSGLGFWISRMDLGLTPLQMAGGFVGSAEFTALFGVNPAPRALVEKLYLNVLHRAGEQAGVDFWTTVLEQRLATVSDVLLAFSESPENQSALATVIATGVPYVPFGVT